VAKIENYYSMLASTVEKSLNHFPPPPK